MVREEYRHDDGVSYLDGLCMKRKCIWLWTEPFGLNQVNCGCTLPAGLLKLSHRFATLTISIRSLEVQSTLLSALLDHSAASMAQLILLSRTKGWDITSRSGSCWKMACRLLYLGKAYIMFSRCGELRHIISITRRHSPSPSPP